MPSFSKFYFGQQTTQWNYSSGSEFTTKGTWGSTSGVQFLIANPFKSGTAQTTVFKTINNASGRVKFFNMVSPPLEAQTLSGTLDLIAVVSENNADANAFFCLHVWVSVGDTNVVRATLINNFLDTGEFPVTTLTGHALGAGAQSIPSTVIQKGDRLVFELGSVGLNNRNITFGYRNDYLDADAVAGVTGNTQNAHFVFSNAIAIAEELGDHCDDPLDFGSGSFVGTLDNKYAYGGSNIKYSTVETDPYDIEFNEFTHTIWGEFTPTVTGMHRISLEGSDQGSAFAIPGIVIFDDTFTCATIRAGGVGGVGLGPAPGDFPNFFPDDTTPWLVSLTAGVTYKILLGNNAGWGDTPLTAGTIVLDIGPDDEPPPPPPANDLCADAEVISGLPVEKNDIDTRYATDEGAVTTCGNVYNGVWYEWEAPTSGYVVLHFTAMRMSFGGSEEQPPPIAAVYTGDCGTLVQVNCGEDHIAWDAVAGTVYKLLIGSTVDGGYYQISFEILPAEASWVEGFEGFADIHTLFGGDWFDNKIYSQTFTAVCKSGWGNPGQGLCQAGPVIPVQSHFEQVAFSRHYFNAALPYGIFELDIRLENLDRGSGGTIFRMGVFGNWNLTSYTGGAPPGHWPNTAASRNYVGRFPSFTTWPFSVNATGDPWVGASTPRRRLYFTIWSDMFGGTEEVAIDTGVDMDQFLGAYHRYKMAFRMSTPLGGGMYLDDGCAELWVDDNLIARVSNLDNFYTDIGATWNGVATNDFGIADNLALYVLDVTNCGILPPPVGVECPPLLSGGGGVGKGGEFLGPNPRLPSMDLGGGATSLCTFGGSVGSSSDPDDPESWCN